jgi:hypothetical protein
MVKYEDLKIGGIYVSLMPYNPEWESLHMCINNSGHKLKNRLYISNLYK